MASPSPTFKPTLIVHGGAGAIHRSTLPPELYSRYRTSLLKYLRSTYKLLCNGSSALDAAVHAVSLMEDDELFNCGRGSVFTSAGTIEMEASVMVSSVRDDWATNGEGAMKRGTGVMLVKRVRHPIQLARELLLRTGYDSNGEIIEDGGNMHSQLSGQHVESFAREWDLEFMSDDWFWTKRRWEEHQRGLKGIKEDITMSQGTVGCICLDQWGNLAVATSTGGLTNKIPGRIGDTPSLGAGFWAEVWEDRKATGDNTRLVNSHQGPPVSTSILSNAPINWNSLAPWTLLQDLFLGNCLRISPPSGIIPELTPPVHDRLGDGKRLLTNSTRPYYHHQPMTSANTHNRQQQRMLTTRRAVALSGTGNGDSFLRVDATRTACAMLRFSGSDSFPLDLAQAVSAVAGPGGELQRCAGNRWGRTGEGQGGLIGIEVEVEIDIDSEASSQGNKKGEVWGQDTRKIHIEKGDVGKGKVVFDFNCGGMFRAWLEEDKDGQDREMMMVFKEEYK
ncbi:hypothetical protein Egran_06622 [Elaphomyces granulatus]|uniref:Asparaginase n=1 Tax=Elaphomyces granulatus TaxID=519963 RepID=A0A232LN68_9EURO|nr:hypothetical protein Egran_06622 [Elaphomyces granulatus]